MVIGVAAASAAVGDLGEQRQISATGANADTGLVKRPVLAYNSTQNQYLAVWAAPAAAQEDMEIFARILGAGGEPVSGQFQISSMGPDASNAYGADQPAVTYNPATNEYLVAWQGDDNTPPLSDGQIEIFVQRLTAAGTEIGTDDQPVSTMGPDGNTNYGAGSPAVAYNASLNEYLVVWNGDDDRFQLLDGESEIFAQRLSAAGAEVGTDDARISTTGQFQNAAFDASEPAVAFNAAANEYMVTWYADDDSPAQVDGDFEIFVQRLTGTGDEILGDRRISSMGPDRDGAFDALEPVITYNSVNNEYLVAWTGREAPLAEFELEIFGQRLAADGSEIGTDDQRISAMGPDGDQAFNGQAASAAHNPEQNEYLVAWAGSEDASVGSEVYAQRMSGAGAEVGTDDQRISAMGPDGQTTGFTANRPSVAFNATADEFLFAWRGREPTFGPLDDEAYVRGMAAADPPPPVPPDTTLDGAAVELAKKLKVKGKQLKIQLAAGCAEACTATASGSVSVKPPKGKAAAKTKRYPLAPATATAAAGAKATLTLQPTGSKKKRKKTTRKIVGALKRGGKANAAITIAFADTVGNGTSVDASAKLKAKSK